MFTFHITNTVFYDEFNDTDKDMSFNKKRDLTFYLLTD